jgi:hypothetical protein
MPRIIELLNSRTGTEGLDGAKQDRRFLVLGITDDIDLRIYIESEISDTYMGLLAREYEIEEWIAPDIVSVKIPYAQVLPTKQDRDRKTGTRKIEINSGSGTQNIKTSRQTISSHRASFVPIPLATPNYNNAINVNESGAVQGVDAYVSNYSFTITDYVAKESVTDSYLAAFDAMKSPYPKFNDGEWTVTDGQLTRTFLEGEILYLGYTLRERTTDDYEITHNFIGSPSVEDLDVGSIEEIDKLGWDYLWVEFKDRFDDDNLNKVPWFAWVERLYGPADFSIFDYVPPEE